MGSASATDRPEGARVSGRLALLRELIGVLLRHPWLLAAAIAPNILLAALGPVQGWLAKGVLNQVTKGDAVFALRELLPLAWIALGVFLGLGLLTLAEKVTNRMIDDRMLIELQRIWFDRCGRGCPGERVARAMKDCENARKILDIFQKELWAVLIGLPAVLIWQLSLEPRWLPALFVAAAPPFAIALLFGGLIQRTSLRILQSVAAVGTAIARGDRPSLCAHQEGFYRQRIRFELWKQCSETTADLSRWLGVVLVLAVSATGLWHVAPARATAGEIALFLVNLGLLCRCFADITRVHNKVREGWPSVPRVFSPSQDLSPSNCPPGQLADNPQPGSPGGRATTAKETVP